MTLDADLTAHRARVLAVMTWLIALPAGAQAPAADPADIGDRLTRNLLARDYMMYGDEALHYAEAAAAVGAMRYAAAAGDGAMLGKLIDRYRGLLDPDSPLVSLRPHVDMNVLGIVPLEIAIRSGDAEFLAAGLAFADAQWREPLANGLTNQTRWWIDDLYMVGMLQIQAFRATGEPRYADRAARQLAAYLPELQQPNGLFFHSPDVPIFWARGNGWVAAALAEVLASLPVDHALRDTLTGHYRDMMRALPRYQTGNGMWRQVVDYEYAWLESSGTAMFGYAMSVGVDLGLLDAETYAPVVERAWRALAAHVDRHGNVREVCIGTGKLNDLEYYLQRPRVSGDMHGQAPLLWLAAARLGVDGHRGAAESVYPDGPH